MLYKKPNFDACRLPEWVFGSFRQGGVLLPCCLPAGIPIGIRHTSKRQPGYMPEWRFRHAPSDTHTHDERTTTGKRLLYKPGLSAMNGLCRFQP
jgi:hypothetical protein